MLSTATLDRLRALYPQGRFEVRRFRPNIVVETAHDEKNFVENAWIRQTLTIGDAVRLSVTVSGERLKPETEWRSEVNSNSRATFFGRLFIPVAGWTSML